MILDGWSLLDVLFTIALVLGVGWGLVAFIGAEFGGDALEGHDLDGGGHGFDVGDHDGPALDGGNQVVELHAAGHDAHLAMWDGSVRVSPLSPAILATGLGGFGGFGLFASLALGWSALAAGTAALAGGILFGLIVYLFYGRLLVGAQGSSEVQVSKLYGTVGTVITPIPDNSVGEIAFVAQGSRITATARSATGQSIPRGQLVIIQEMAGPIAVVRETR